MMYKNPLQQQARQIYQKQKARCENPEHVAFGWYGAKGIRVKYSFEEFWNWFEKNYKTFSGKNPTIGRVDHSKDYSLDNIEIQSKKDNTKERNSRCGNPSIQRRRKVLCFNAADMSLIAEYESTIEAEKATGIHNSNIRMYCLGKLKQTKAGLTFRFKEVNIGISRPS